MSDGRAVTAPLGSDVATAPITILGELRAAALGVPDRDAIRTDADSCTYGELSSAVDRLAAGIVDLLGDDPEPVAILVEGDIAPIVAQLGVMRAGKIAAVLDPWSSDSVFRLRGLRCRAAVTTGGPGPAGSVASHVEHIFEIGVGDPPIVPLPEVSSEATAAIVYTSGAGRLGKPVMRRHCDMLAAARELIDRHGYGEADRIGVMGKPGHWFAKSEVLAGLMARATVLPFDCRRRGATQFREWLRHDMPTVLAAAPSMVHRLLADVPGDVTFTSLRLIRFSGEPLHGDVVLRLRRHLAADCRVIQVYGAAEFGSITELAVEGIDDARSHIPTGRSEDGIRVMNADESGIGQIVVNREQPVSYWPNAPSAGGGPHDIVTGDRGWLDDRGRLFWAGRSDRILRLDAMLYDAARVEWALRRSSAVADAAVASQGDGGVVTAWVVPAAKPGPTLEELVAELDHVPSGAQPGVLSLVREIPRDERGRVLWSELPDPDPARMSPEPIDELEQELVAIWQSHLPVAEVSALDDFFDLGGSSIEAMAMFAELKSGLGHDLAPSTLIHAPTVRALADAVRGGMGERSQESLVPVRPLGTRRPFFCVHGGGGGVFFVRDLAEYMHPDRPVLALQAAGFDGTPPPYRTIEEMAERYLAELRMAQPVGPYALCGLSLGGLIAWEMAQQLHAAGEDVEMLAMLDTKPLDRMSQATMDAIDDAAVGSKARKYMGMRWRTCVKLLRMVLLKALLKTGRPLPEWFELRNSYFWPLHAKAARSYEVTEYFGPVTIIGEIDSSDVHHEIWEPMVKGAYEVFEVPAHHMDLVREPNVRTVATFLESRMAAAEEDRAVRSS